MAIGDYNKTTYANGVAPAINATNLNNNENKVKELDTAVDGLETTVSGNTYDIFTLETTVSGLEAREIPVSTTSRIFDLTGDRVPPIPDDPAGVTYFQDAWATTDGWVSSGCNLTVSGGKLVATLTASTFWLSRGNSLAPNNLIVFRAKASQTRGVSMVAKSPWTLLKNVGLSTAYQTFSAYNTVAGTNAFEINSSVWSIGDTLEIDWVYIGTGAYLSKTVDRAGVPWTNFGALPVDGPFGKGLQFNGAQYLQAPGPMIGTTGTIAVMFTPKESSTRYDIARHAPSNGYLMRTDTTGKLVLESYNGTAAETITSNSSWTGGERCAFVCLITPSSIKIYVNGVYDNQRTSSPNVNNNSPLYVGNRPSGVTPFIGTIYAIRADSRVWTDEEIARWSRDPYSEESIPIASTPTANAIMQWPSSGNFGAGSNLDADTIRGLYDTVSSASQPSQNGYVRTVKLVTDLNSISGNGVFFETSSDPANAPSNSFFNGVQWYHNSNASYKFQLVSHSSGGSLYCRWQVNGTWGSWQSLFHTGNVGTNWPTALAATLGTGWTTALAATYGSVSRIPIATKTGSSTGTAGDISADSSYLYVCTATNTWKRVALTSF